MRLSMNLGRSIDALHNALANVDQAIGALELLREHQEQRQGAISSASVERLITEREIVLHAIAQIEKLTPAPPAKGSSPRDGARSDLASRRKWAHVSRRHDLEYPRNEDGY